MPNRLKLSHRSLAIEKLDARQMLSASPLGPGPPESQDVIVWLKPSSEDAGTTGREIAAAHGGQVGHVYEYVPGFSASLPQSAITALENNPNVISIEPDAEAFLQAQVLPTGIDRTEADMNDFASINENPSDASFSFSVATIDTGIDVDHPDLNIAGGRNVVQGADDLRYGDGHGHGTHVAGTMAAIDNAEGVVGMAPGASVYAVRSFNNSGRGTSSSVLAGMEHILNERLSGRPIAVLNMSFQSSSSGGAADIYLQQMAEAGIVMFGATGNNGGSGSVYPARNEHVISVAALADSNGQSGLPGADTSAGPDETIADFSNCCSIADIAAPGVDIYSTSSKRNGYDTLSGTSMASPHAAGAAALFIAQYVDSWSTGGIPSDLLDTVVVRESLTATAEAAGQFAVRQDDPTRGVYVLQADDDWTTPPVVSITSQIPTSLQGSVSLTVDARDVDTTLGELTFEVGFTDSLGSRSSITPSIAWTGPGDDFPYGSYELSFNSATIVPDTIGSGTYDLDVTAIDAQSTPSNPAARLTTNNISVFVDDEVNTAPVANITSPLASGGVVSGTVPLQVDVTDDGVVATVVFEITNLNTNVVTSISATETVPPTPTDPAVWTAFWDTTSALFNNEDYSVSVMATDTLGLPSSVDVETPITVNNTQETGTIAVADLDGYAQDDSKQFWSAFAEVYITNSAGEPVEGATVYGNWRSGTGGTATTWSDTDSSGMITLRYIRLRDRHSPVTFTVDRVEHPTFTYEPLLNADPDGDSVISETGEIKIVITRDSVASLAFDSTAEDDNLPSNARATDDYFSNRLESRSSTLARSLERVLARRASRGTAIDEQSLAALNDDTLVDSEPTWSPDDLFAADEEGNESWLEDVAIQL